MIAIRKRFLLRFDGRDNQRIASRILRHARTRLAGSETRELERIAQGGPPRTIKVKSVDPDGNQVISYDRPFQRLVTEFSSIL